MTTEGENEVLDGTVRCVRSKSDSGTPTLSLDSAFPHPEEGKGQGEQQEDEEELASTATSAARLVFRFGPRKLYMRSRCLLVRPPTRPHGGASRCHRCHGIGDFGALPGVLQATCFDVCVCVSGCGCGWVGGWVGVSCVPKVRVINFIHWACCALCTRDKIT